MSFQQVEGQAPINGKYMLPPLDPGQTAFLRRRAVGVNPFSSTVSITRPPVLGTAVSWRQQGNMGQYADGGVSLAWSAGIGTQGTPLIQNSGAGFRGSHTFGNPASNGDRRVGLRHDISTVGDIANPDYYFRFNYLNWSCHTSTGGVGTVLASGLGQAKDLFSITLYEDKVQFVVAGNVVATVAGTPSFAQYYPSVYSGENISGMVATWCKLQGNLARTLRFGDYSFIGSWDNTSTSEGTGYNESTRILYSENYTGGVIIRFPKGLKLYMPQGRGIRYQLFLNDELKDFNMGFPDTIVYEVNDLPIPAAGYNEVRIMFSSSTFYVLDPQYSVVYL